MLSRNKTFRIAKRLQTDRFFANACPGHGVGMLMSQSVFDYCTGHGLVQTRLRAYKKYDQAWVAQKNGAVVRRLVGYGRPSGAAAPKALARLNASSPCTSTSSTPRSS